MHEPKIVNKFKTGLVQEQPKQILNDDAFPVLQNAWVYRNDVIRRTAWQNIERLARIFTSASLGNSGMTSPWSFTIYSTLTPPITETTAQIQLGSVVITINTDVFTDQGNGVLMRQDGNTQSTINYLTSAVTIYTSQTETAATISFIYFPGLPAMGILDRYKANNNLDNVYFDTTYAYIWNGTGFQEFLPGFTWNFENYTFPYPQNYWQDENNAPIFWVTSNQGYDGGMGTVIRWTTGTGSWYDFTPAIDATNTMYQAAFLVPFRGMLFAFNTYEGTTAGNFVQAEQFRNRVRCSAIGTPFTAAQGTVTQFNATAWNDTIPGQGYFQDIPTTEEITGVWLVMNQIIIKTVTKTWLLTHTGMNTAPFKIDLVDDQQGTFSPFGMTNMGSYITGIGNRSISNTTPTSVTPIDDKIWNLFFEINRDNEGLARVYGVRNFINRTNSYIYPYQPDDVTVVTYPNRRLIQNYENGAWAIFEDSYTCLGYFRGDMGTTWANSKGTWAESNFPWSFHSTEEAPTAAGNQQGYIGLLDSTVVEGTSLFISAITNPGMGQALTFTSTNNNLATGTVVSLSGFVGDYAALNGTVAQVQTLTPNTFYLFTYNAMSTPPGFNIAVGFANTMAVYIGGGEISVRRNFSIMTKAYNRLEQGQGMHVSYVDTLSNWQLGGTVQLNVYASLNTSNPVNTPPQNTSSSSLFGNTISLGNPTSYNLTQINNRAIVNQRANMITLEFTLSDATMASDNFSMPFQLSSFTIWNRAAGRPLMPLGGG